MNNATREIIYAFLEAFTAYPITDASLQGQVDGLQARMLEFADKNQDITTFYTQLAASGLQEEYTALVGKVAMASMEPANSGGEVAGETISVKAFVEQYRLAYNEVKKAGYRQGAKAAYERIFAVADLTDDMLEAQIILERERLLWKIVSEDSLDVFRPILQALDPLQPTAIAIEKHIEVYEQAQSAEELEYALARLELEKLTLVGQGVSKINMAARLGTLIIGYSASKLNTQLSGGQGEEGEKSLYNMISFRYALQRMINFMQANLGLSIDDLLADEGVKIWLLSPANVDELGRVKISLNPQNYGVIREVIAEEILSERSVLDLLKLTPEKMPWFGFEGGAKDEFEQQAQVRAQELNANLTYYQYKEDLGKALDQAMPNVEDRKGNS